MHQCPLESWLHCHELRKHMEFLPHSSLCSIATCRDRLAIFHFVCSPLNSVRSFKVKDSHAHLSWISSTCSRVTWANQASNSFAFCLSKVIRYNLIWTSVEVLHVCDGTDRYKLCEVCLTNASLEMIIFSPEFWTNKVQFPCQKMHRISLVWRCHKCHQHASAFSWCNGKAIIGLHLLPSSHCVVIDALVQLCGNSHWYGHKWRMYMTQEIFERRNSLVQIIVSVHTLLPFSSLSIYHGKRKTGWTK
jgi:hypothetical protein